MLVVSELITEQEVTPDGVEHATQWNWYTCWSA